MSSAKGRGKSKKRTSSDSPASPSAPYKTEVVGSITSIIHNRNIQLLIPIGSDTGLLLLPTNSPVVLRGKVQIAVVAGVLSIDGYRLTPNTFEFHNVYSPSSHARATLTGLDGLPIADLLKTIDDLPKCCELLSASELESCLQQTDRLSNSDDRVTGVLLRRLTSPACDDVTQFPRFRDLFECDLRDPAAEGLGFSLTSVKCEDQGPVGFCETNEILEVCATIRAALCTMTQDQREHKESNDPPATSTSDRGHSFCVLVGGPKSSGKSTLVRYLTNQLLQCEQSDTVAVLDCDLGQPEFTPAGFVSLTLVNRPLFGPPFTHQLDTTLVPCSQCFVGSLTPSDNPDLYLRCLRHVYASYVRLPLPRPPLLVNTMGWTQGLGLVLIADQILMTRPHLIVQLELDRIDRNLPLLDPDGVREIRAWPNRVLTEEQLDHRVLSIQSPASSCSPRNRHRLGAPDHRDLTLLAHLFARLRPSSSVAAQPDQHPSVGLLLHSPYRVRVCLGTETQDSPASEQNGGSSPCRQQVVPLALHLVNPPSPQGLSPCQLMSAVNATLVAMCQAPPQLMVEPTEDSHPFTLSEHPVCECFGLGIIRSADPRQGLLYILTGVPPSRLTKVNALLRGTVNLPECLLQEQAERLALYWTPSVCNSAYVCEASVLGSLAGRGAAGRTGLPSKRAYPKIRISR